MWRSIWRSTWEHFGSILRSIWDTFWHQMALGGPRADRTSKRSNHMCFFDQSAFGDHIVETKWPPCVPFATYTIQNVPRFSGGGATFPHRIILDT